MTRDETEDALSGPQDISEEKDECNGVAQAFAGNVNCAHPPGETMFAKAEEEGTGSVLGNTYAAPTPG